MRSPTVSQVVLDSGAGTLISKDANLIKIWLDTAMIPLYAASASATLLALRAIFHNRAVRLRHANVAWANQDLPGDVSLDAQSAGLFAEAKEHIAKHGGAVIFAFKLARLLGCLVLLGLSLATFVLEEHSRPVSDGLSLFAAVPLDRRPKRKHKTHAHFSYGELLQVAMIVSFFYATLLGLAAVTAIPARSRIFAGHINFLLLTTFSVYAYRDLWPLITYTLIPKDISEGWLLWAKTTVLFLCGIVLPLTSPRSYIPVDPKEPMAELNPEQVTPIYALLLYTYMDAVVLKGYRMPHLGMEELPPLADYDYAKNIKKWAFPHLDPFSDGHVKRHLFFGFMRTFRREYIVMTAMIILKVIAGFASPIAMNRLLTYMNYHGENATVRPWVWIILLFLGPLTRSIAYQWYIFITSRTFVHAEAIVTQLVFEHALRIRMKAETDTSATGFTTAVPTPDSASTSVRDVFSEGVSGGSGEGTSDSSTARLESEQSKLKDKDVQAPEIAAKKRVPLSGNLVGKINNLVTTDLANIGDGRHFLMAAIYIPLEISLCIWFLHVILGWSAYVGLAVMLMCFPLPSYIGQRIHNIQAETMKRTDARVQYVTETMNVLRMIKLFGWESGMYKRITDKREDELKFVWKQKLWHLANDMVNFLVPIVAMIATYTTYTVLMKRQLSAAVVFSSMSVFDMLRDQLREAFWTAATAIQGKVSLDRVNDFLKETELLDSFAGAGDKDDLTGLFATGTHDTKDVIGIKHSTFAWSNDGDGTVTPSRRTFLLHVEDEVLFKRHCLNLIVGPTGSGKTSMLMALLGELHHIPSGPDSWYNLPREGGVAYAAQESWVQNETIRDNIIFGAPFHEVRYNNVLYQCALERDLALFDAGDRTEVGEKGLTLSGGQKARITLARALYSAADILLLDDILAALDVHTAKWIVNKCFKGDLIAGRTVILVTHNVAIVSPIAHFVVSLTRDGRIHSQGTLSDALNTAGALVVEANRDAERIESGADEVAPVHPEGHAKNSDGKLILAEEVAEGRLSWSAFKLFFSGLCGNGRMLFWFSFVGGLSVGELLDCSQTWWLGHWASQYREGRDVSEVSVPYYLGVFAAGLGLAYLLYTISVGLYTHGSIRASRIIHHQLLESVLGTTLRWLDTTSTARVIARFTQDIRAVDDPIPWEFVWLTWTILSMLARFIAVVLFSPIFLLPGMVAAGLAGWCGHVYMRSQMSVKREMSNARSPVLGHFGAAIAGLTSIRAYGAQQAFIHKSLNRIDKYTRAARTFYNLNRWMSIRIDALGGLFTSGLAAYLLYHGLPSVADTGFSLNMAIASTGMILYCIRILNDFEISGNSLERIQAYIMIEQEPKSTKEGQPPAYWPASGDLRAENLSARYSPDGPKVLHDISFHIKSGERVGVVGRTGSGKTSLTLALLRCIVTEGDVYYDGIPISAINLEALRSSITIIPQVPELLSGTLRQNLDPFERYDDATLNGALSTAGLFSLQSRGDDSRLTLDSAISSGGANLSVGERQIIALARAVVRGSKLLILDEATSAIDHKTDSIVQASLRRHLTADTTLLTVAHRLQTIVDSDKIMVLDAGRIVEFGRPIELLRKPSGFFKALVDESGDKDALYAAANALGSQ